VHNLSAASLMYLSPAVLRGPAARWLLWPSFLHFCCAGPQRSCRSGRNPDFAAPYLRVMVVQKAFRCVGLQTEDAHQVDLNVLANLEVDGGLML
jgi:hypothetical protein